MQNNNYLSDYIKSLYDQIQSLKGEVMFLKTELSGKNETINILVDSVSRKEYGNITTEIHYNAKNKENKITKEVTDTEEPSHQKTKDSKGLRNEDNSNASESTKKLCDDAKIDYLDSSININPRRHLNNSKLHLNTKGSRKLLQNFVTFIKKLFSA